MDGRVSHFNVLAIFILEAPNDEAVAKMALAISSLGSVRTNSHRVFTEEEFRRIVISLP